MAHPLRIQLSRKKGYKKPEGAVIVARPSRWGNPFKIGETYLVFHELGWGLPLPVGRDAPDGEDICSVVTVEDAAQAVEMYRAWMKSCMTTAVVKVDISPLRGKQLGCWCKLTEACHADVLCEIANAPEE